MLVDLLELASNKTLEHDPQTLERLVKFTRNIPEKVDVTLNASLGAMVKISRDGMENAELEPGELEIAGDPIIGQRFAQVISELNIDWEALLAEQIGESPAKAVSFAAGQANSC